MQQTKQAGMESEELVLLELADWLQDSMEDGVRYVFGPGSTLHGLAQNLGLETTLLGVDVIENGQVLAHDVTEAQLFELVEGHPSRLLVTAIGGQGHILGRGNQQISPRVVRAIGLDHLRANDRVGIERNRAASRDQEAHQQRLPLVGEQFAQGA